MKACLPFLSRTSLIALPLLGMLVLAGRLTGATYTYDRDGDSSNGATNATGGTWDTTNVLWFTNTSTPDQAWFNNTTTPDSAMFGDGSTASIGSVYNINTTGNLYVNTLTFQPIGTATLNGNATVVSYTMDSGRGSGSTGNIIFAGDSPTMTVNAHTDIWTRLTATSFIKDGTGTLIIRNNNNNLGAVTVKAGMFDVYNTLVTTSVEVQAGARFDTHSGTVWTMDSMSYSGTQASTFNGFTNGGTYTIGSGGLTINSSSVNVSAGNGADASVTTTLTLNGQLTMSGGNFNINTSNSAIAPTVSTTRVILNNHIVATANGTIANGGNGHERLELNAGAHNVTVNGTAVTLSLNAVTTDGTSAASITKLGDGTLSIGGNESNSYTGLTTVTAGTLKLNKGAGATAVAGNILVNGGTLDWDQANQVADTANITMTSGFLRFDSRTETFANLTVSGGQLNNNGDTNGGYVNITGTFSASGGTHYSLNSGGQWNVHTTIFNTGLTQSLGLNGNGTRLTLYTVGAGGITLNGQSINIEKAGDTGRAGSELALYGKLTTNGNSNIGINNTGNSHGISQINLGNGTRTIEVVSGTTTMRSAVVSLTDGGGDTPAPRTGVVGGIEKTGSGTLVFESANTYTGNTTINAGILRLGVNGSIDNSPIITVAPTATFNVAAVSGYTVKANQTLQGGGTVQGAVTIASGAILSAGTTGGDITQTLAFSSGLTLNSGSTTYLDVVDIGNSDLIDVTGSFTQQTGAKIVVNPSIYSGTFMANAAFDLINWTTVGTFSSNLGGNYRDGSADSSFDLDLPDIAGSGYLWDISDFTGSGVLRMVVAPEPSRAVLILIAVGALCVRRQRKVQTAVQRS